MIVSSTALAKDLLILHEKKPCFVYRIPEIARRVAVAKLIASNVTRLAWIGSVITT